MHKELTSNRAAVIGCGDHIEIVGDHLRSARASHTDLTANLGRLSDLAALMRSAITDGQHYKAVRLLDDLNNEVGLANENHRATAIHHRSVGRALEGARRSLDIVVPTAEGTP